MANVAFLIVVALGGFVASQWRPVVGGEETSPAFVMFFALLIGATLRAIIGRLSR